MVVKRFLKVGEIFYINLEFITLYVETFYGRGGTMVASTIGIFRAEASEIGTQIHPNG